MFVEGKKNPLSELTSFSSSKDLVTQGTAAAAEKDRCLPVVKA